MKQLDHLWYAINPINHAERKRKEREICNTPVHILNNSSSLTDHSTTSCQVSKVGWSPNTKVEGHKRLPSVKDYFNRHILKSTHTIYIVDASTNASLFIFAQNKLIISCHPHTLW